MVLDRTDCLEQQALIDWPGYLDKVENDEIEPLDSEPIEVPVAGSFALELSEEHAVDSPDFLPLELAEELAVECTGFLPPELTEERVDE